LQKIGGRAVMSRTRIEPEISEHHEIRVRVSESTIVFLANSEDGRLTIRQERDGGRAREVCAITLADTEELRAFFKGLRRTLASLGHPVTSGEGGADVAQRKADEPHANDQREAVVAQARQRNPQAFAPWTRQEEQAVAQEHAVGLYLVHGLQIISG